LTELNAQQNQLTDISGLERLTKLNYLSLANNSIVDVSALSACGNISELHLSNNQITDISSLRFLNKLMYFYFSFNQVQQLPQWNRDCSLVTIDGSNNLLTSLEPLSGLVALNNVYMDYNSGISTVDSLAYCPVLIHVNLFGTSVTDVTALTAQSVVVNYDPTFGE
jgi:internalin A